MIKLFKQNRVSLLQKKYDKLMREAYDLARSNPAESQQKQIEAQEIQRQIIDKTL
ncbi:Lacal_2735 family protein [Ekhidna sp.]